LPMVIEDRFLVLLLVLVELCLVVEW